MDISPEGKPSEVDHPLYHIHAGVVIIPKNGVVPHGTVICGSYDWGSAPCCHAGI